MAHTEIPSLYQSPRACKISPSQKRTIKINDRLSVDISEMDDSISNRMKTESDSQGYTLKHSFH